MTPNLDQLFDAASAPRPLRSTIDRKHPETIPYIERWLKEQPDVPLSRFFNDFMRQAGYGGAERTFRTWVVGRYPELWEARQGVREGDS